MRKIELILYTVLIFATYGCKKSTINSVKEKETFYKTFDFNIAKTGPSATQTNSGAIVSDSNGNIYCWYFDSVLQGDVKRIAILKTDHQGNIIWNKNYFSFSPGNVVCNGFSGNSLSDPRSLWYNLIYAIMVIAFTYFYTALIFNPTEMADNLKRNNSFIPGVKPGEPTANYIATIMDRITLPGACFLALAGILPGIATLLGVTSGFASFFGGTSMLIGVGVILDTLQQVESYLLMNHYDGLMKTGHIVGRTAVAPTRASA